jgi:hypothetical protein
MNNSTFGIHFVLRTNKIINGLAPVYTRLTVDSKRCEISVKRKILPDVWDFGNGKAKPNNPDNKQLNSYVAQLRIKMVIYYQKFVLSKQMPTVEAIRDKYIRLDVPDMTLCKLIDYHNTNCKDLLKWGILKNYFTRRSMLNYF